MNNQKLNFMGKKKKVLTPEEEKEVKLKKLRKFYDNANEELNLKGKSVIEQVAILVNRCDDLQCDICKNADMIKIEDLEQVQQLTKIDKKTYLDFVRIAALKNNGKLKEKAITKFENDFNDRLLSTNLRHAFLASYMDDKDLHITDEDNQEYKPFTDYQSDDFAEVLEHSAKIREYLNLVLWQQYKAYAKAAEYITNLKLNYKDFKNLVDWQHYKDGGYPSPSTPSKIWSIFNKFNYAHRLLTKWGYNETANELNKEFGLLITEGTPNPVDHPWMNSDNED